MSESLCWKQKKIDWEHKKIDWKQKSTLQTKLWAGPWLEKLSWSWTGLVRFLHIWSWSESVLDFKNVRGPGPVLAIFHDRLPPNRNINRHATKTWFGLVRYSPWFGFLIRDLIWSAFLFMIRYVIRNPWSGRKRTIPTKADDPEGRKQTIFWAKPDDLWAK